MTTAVRTRGRLLALMAATLLLVLALGFLLGKAWTEGDDNLGGWHTGVAAMGGRQFSVEYDGWWYGASDAVPTWIDAQGSWHESGWPTCLQDKVGQSVTVKFQATRAAVDGAAFRPVVAVDCRP